MPKTLNLFSKALVSLILSITISACSFPGVYKINVQQGNIITQDMLDKLKVGMTRSQVHFVLGAPIVEDLFNQTTEDYVYTFQKAGGKIKKQHIAIFYSDEKMTHFTGTLIKEHSAY